MPIHVVVKMPDWADALVASSEFWAVSLAALWGIGAFHGWWPGSFPLDLSSAGLGQTEISPAWLVGYAAVRVVKKIGTPGEIPFLNNSGAKRDAALNGTTTP